MSTAHHQVKETTWVFKEELTLSPDLLEAVSGHEILAKLLSQRGITSGEEARTFLDEKTYTPTGAWELPDTDKAVERILQAIESKQHITVYGDYDVDGVTGTSVLYSVLKQLGADVDYYIPNRLLEGYGLNLKAVSVIASKRRTKLIVTCDLGVSNFAEINFAKSLGVDTIVLDHHTMPEMLPPAVAVIHPKFLNEDHPLYNLPGVGVAYKVCQALFEKTGKPEAAEQLLDLVTMGMIADMVPLVKENRYLVRIGLPKLVATTRVGLQKLLAMTGQKANTDLVGFGLAPRINAAGRLSDANKAVELMTTQSEEVAEALSQELQTENTRRQEICEQVFMEVEAKLAQNPQLLENKCLAIYDKTWHHGVIGIVASRLVEKYQRPVFIAQHEEEEKVIRGSARSIDGVDLYQVLKLNEHLLSRWGGHKMAAGFSLEEDKGQEFCKALFATCNKILEGVVLSKQIEIDLTLPPENCDLELATKLEMLAPFGISNKKPVLCMKELMCQKAMPLGKDGKHVKIYALDPKSGEEFECVMWNGRDKKGFPEIEESIDIAFMPDLNHFNGKTRLQLILVDWRASNWKERAEKAKKMQALQMSESSPAQASVAPASTATSSATSAAPSASSASTSPSNSGTQSTPITNADPARFLARKQTWQDLRNHENKLDILAKAAEKIKDDLIIFAESAVAVDNCTFTNRASIKQAKHLLVWQFPPTLELFQELVAKTDAEKIYLIGSPEANFDHPSNFLKRLYGLAKFAVAKRDGQIEGELLTCLMGTTKLAVALGLKVLKAVHKIDWYVEDGIIFLDLLEEASTAMEELPEYIQLKSCLNQISNFRNWCAESSIKDIQLNLLNGVALTSPANEDSLKESSAYDISDQQFEPSEA
ncbi:MAG: single-stranded-DNA-specific exonuclease RecJ [Candidatus Melainabacteria bacterium]|nr:single-stranded-DNA-specific exonuclease RecJ [Candidatus Melainabacteria bacterium]